MKFNFKLMIAALGLSFAASSQNVPLQNSAINKRGCATAVPPAEWDAWFNKKVAEYKENASGAKTANITITIPVIVHVIHGGSAVGVYPNISAAQVRSQINVLNKDFAGNGFNSQKLATTGFSVVGAANTHITFCLAQLDPSGTPLAEAGIDRVNFNTNGWTNPNSPNTLNAFQSLMDNTIKPSTIWDPTAFFNIWVSDVNANTEILGYATFPAGSSLAGLTSNLGNANTDGIWIWSRSFGNVGTLSAPYNLGRTASHETGHWLGLRHIGGDGNGNSAGDCNATDYCDDTPSQKGGFNTGAYGQNFGAPAYPLHANTCGSPYGDMFMNFMDYTDDAINYMFTPDQNLRMQTALANGYFRNLLSASSSSLCADMPLADFFTDTIVCLDAEIVPSNPTAGSPAPTFSWTVEPSAGVLFSPNSTDVSPGINFPSPGGYTITMVATNSIGVTSNTVALRVDECTGIKESFLSGYNVNLAPNPTTGQLALITALKATKDLKVSVYNSLGQVVLSKQFNASEEELNLDLGACPNGVYSVSISTGKDRIVKRLIISK